MELVLVDRHGVAATPAIEERIPARAAVDRLPHDAAEAATRIVDAPVAGNAQCDCDEIAHRWFDESEL